MIPASLGVAALLALGPVPADANASASAGVGASGPVDAQIAPAEVAASSRAAPKKPVPAGKHLVLTNHYGLAMGLNKIPSGEVGIFLGHALSSLGPTRENRRWAFGYQLGISIGGADRYYLSALTHRHHLMAVSFGGVHPRLYAAVGGGIAIFAGWFLPERPSIWRPSVAEVEGQLGYIFRHPERRRLVGVVGGKARVGWNAASLETAPVPQVGAFVGFLLR